MLFKDVCRLTCHFIDDKQMRNCVGERFLTPLSTSTLEETSLPGTPHSQAWKLLSGDLSRTWLRCSVSNSVPWAGAIAAATEIQDHLFRWVMERMGKERRKSSLNPSSSQRETSQIVAHNAAGSWWNTISDACAKCFLFLFYFLSSQVLSTQAEHFERSPALIWLCCLKGSKIGTKPIYTHRWSHTYDHLT